jgi:uncharacterized lipoprotein YddW (UPF0748 family)
MRPTLLTRRQLLMLGCTAAICKAFRPLGNVFAESVTMKESRAVLDEGLHWATQDGAETVCRRIKMAGFNVFIPCVWHGRGTTWPSNLSPWDSKFASPPKFDPLERLIQVANKYEIEVHPWFTVMRRDREFFHEFYDGGTPRESFDVHRPRFREFISTLILEVVQKYSVHGVNLDYIRAGGVCESQHCIEEYRQKTGRDLLLDNRKRMIPGSVFKELFEWQEAAVEDIVRRVSTGARQIKGDIVLSVDAYPGNRVDQVQGRNSMKWADMGLIDVVYMMHYEDSPDWGSLRSFQQQMKRPEALVVLCGNYDKPDGNNEHVTSRSGLKVADLLNHARDYQMGNGVGIYLYGRITDDQIVRLQQDTFKVPARPDWKRATVPFRSEREQAARIDSPVLTVK